MDPKKEKLGTFYSNHIVCFALEDIQRVNYDASADSFEEFLKKFGGISIDLGSTQELDVTKVVGVAEDGDTFQAVMIGFPEKFVRFLKENEPDLADFYAVHPNYHLVRPGLPYNMKVNEQIKDEYKKAVLDGTLVEKYNQMKKPKVEEEPSQVLVEIANKIGQFVYKNSNNSYERAKTYIQNMDIQNLFLSDGVLTIRLARPSMIIRMLSELEKVLGLKIKIEEATQTIMNALLQFSTPEDAPKAIDIAYKLRNNLLKKGICVGNVVYRNSFYELLVHTMKVAAMEIDMTFSTDVRVEFHDSFMLFLSEVVEQVRIEYSEGNFQERFDNFYASHNLRTWKKDNA